MCADRADLPKRKRIRLAEYDYAQNGAYFITICTRNRRRTLGEIRRGGALLRPLEEAYDDCVVLYPIGMICETQIRALENRYDVMIDNWVIMPNHIHLIVIADRAEQSPAPTISEVVCAFKSITAKLANEMDGTAGRKIWQRSFYDHIIRNEDEYHLIWNYIEENPLKWEDDRLYSE